MSLDDRAAIKRRNELAKMQERAVAERENDTSPDEAGEQSDGEELTGFLRSLRSDKDKRKYQLGLVKELYEDPLKLNFKTQFVPNSSTPEEIAERKMELRYRIDMLKAVMEITEGELNLLSRAAPPDEKSESEAQQCLDEPSQKDKGDLSTD
jgi:hypothetical protein